MLLILAFLYDVLEKVTEWICSTQGGKKNTYKIWMKNFNGR
jgi:hypothetical protein